MSDLADQLRAMSERERAHRRPDDTAEASSYYDGVSDGLVMAAEFVEAREQPLSSLADPAE